MPSYINAIGLANPEHRFLQEDIARFMIRASSLNNEEARKLKIIYKKSGIKFRHSVLSDYGLETDFTFYNGYIADGYRPSTSKRMQVYRAHAAALSIQAITRALELSNINANEVTHLICVSCTGMYAPGLDIDIIHGLQLKPSVYRSSINFMGCYAAINGLRLCHDICKANSEAKVLLVCTELCSIHFQNDFTEDNLLANALFADGAAAVIVSNNKTNTTRFEIQHFYNAIASEGSKDMAWQIGDTGFEMKLSAYVPEIIAEGIERFIQDLLLSAGMAHKGVEHYAIHPGGIKILERIESTLGLSKAANQYAYKVLENYGNMSSATILFVLDELSKNIPVNKKDEQVLGLAFGPGLTLESLLLKTV